MKKKKYRMGSWWLLWEDLLFPEEGIKEKFINRAKKFKNAGVDTIVIFGFHFRWDYIYNWERIHLLLTFIVEICHNEGIMVFEHHSANLVHRVSSFDEYQNVNMKNRHHVPCFPSREFADTMTFDGHKLNDFRMLSVQDGKPCYLSAYNAEIFCMNNTDFIKAYQKYLKKLLKTGVDGLMCDDVIYYPGWDGCGCKYCRKKFKDQYGHDLPPVNDESFWGNYESLAFKDWLNMHYHDSLDFLNIVKKTVGTDFQLMSCCSNSTSKSLDAYGMNTEIMAKSLNNVMLEICGEIISDKHDYCGQIPDMLLHKAIADKYGFPNIGLGYAHNQDSAFVIWAFNKIFTSSTWISTLTGRFGVSEDVRKTIPDEADIIQEAYNFEKEHEDLFRGKSSAKLAVLFSLDNLMYNGCAQDDYSQPWCDITIELFKQNIQFDVVVDIPNPAEYPVLLLSNFDCVSGKENNLLLEYMKNNGTIIATSLLGTRDERGILKEKSFLTDLGAEFKNGQFDWNIPSANLFDKTKRFVKGSMTSYDIYHKGQKAKGNQWISSGTFHWLPRTSINKTIDKVKKLMPDDEIKLSCPEGWVYRVIKNNDKYFIHLLVSNFKAVPYKNFRNNLINEAVVEKLEFSGESGTISFISSKNKATLHSPDLDRSISLQGVNNNFSFDLNGIKRYLIIEV